ncbi:MAG: dihydrodipicolinate synthase family protein, partial [Spirochaetota bacterium]
MDNRLRPVAAPAFSGFVAAPFTPLAADGSLEVSSVGRYAEHLIASGVSAVFVNGTTGEGYSLSVEERKRMVEAWMQYRGEALRVIAHVGAESIRDATELARHASASGVDAIGAMSPVFFKPDLDAMIGWCRSIAAAAPEIPFYYYHIPSLSGAAFRVFDLLERVEHDVPSFRGVKFTHDDLMDLGLSLAVDDGRYDILFGRDEMLLSALALGAKGMVGSTYNYAMPVYRELVRAYEAGEAEAAIEAQRRAARLVGILNAHGGGLVCGKAMMHGVGLDLGPCRVPNRTIGR